MREGNDQPPGAAAPGPRQHLARAKTRRCLAPNGSFARPGWVTFGEHTRVNSRECRSVLLRDVISKGWKRDASALPGCSLVAR